MRENNDVRERTGNENSRNGARRTGRGEAVEPELVACIAKTRSSVGPKRFLAERVSRLSAAGNSDRRASKVECRRVEPVCVSRLVTGVLPRRAASSEEVPQRIARRMAEAIRRTRRAKSSERLARWSRRVECVGSVSVVSVASSSVASVGVASGVAGREPVVASHVSRRCH